MSTFVITDLRPAGPAFARRSATPNAGGLRLTHRGRVVVVILALAAVLALSVMFGSGSVATSEQGVATPTAVIVVAPGETLWGIASELAAATGERDVRDVMAQIERLNVLDSTMLAAGQKLRVPVAE